CAGGIRYRRIPPSRCDSENGSTAYSSTNSTAIIGNDTVFSRPIVSEICDGAPDTSPSVIGERGVARRRKIKELGGALTGPGHDIALFEKGCVGGGRIFAEGGCAPVSPVPWAAIVAYNCVCGSRRVVEIRQTTISEVNRASWLMIDALA